MQKTGVFDIFGKLLLTKKDENDNISLGELPNGMYYLRCYSDKETDCVKIIKID